MQDNLFNTLSFLMLPLDPRTAIHEEGFALLDNLEAHSAVTDYIATNPLVTHIIASENPTKVMFILVIACLKGTMLIRADMTEYHLQANDIQIITPGTIGESLNFSPDCKLAVMAFSDKRFAKEMNATSLRVAQRFLRKTTKISVSADDMQGYMDIYTSLKKKISRHGYAFKKEIVLSYVQILLCDAGQFILDHLPDEPDKPRSRQQQLYMRFIEDVQHYHARERSVGFYADRQCVTPRYLSRAVRQASGKTAAEWIRDYVMLEAKALLKSGRHNVQQIADLLGFPTQSAFGIYFKKSAGCSPKAYREK